MNAAFCCFAAICRPSFSRWLSDGLGVVFHLFLLVGSMLGIHGGLDKLGQLGGTSVQPAFYQLLSAKAGLTNLALSIIFLISCCHCLPFILFWSKRCHIFEFNHFWGPFLDFCSPMRKVLTHFFVSPGILIHKKLLFADRICGICRKYERSGL